MRTRAFVDKCRHFTGVSSRADGSRLAYNSSERGQCAAGVYYDDVQKPGSMMPCFHPEPNRPRAECEKCSWKTPEEIIAETAAREEAFQKSMARLALCRPAIIEHSGYTARNQNGASGTLPCPACKTGTLHYSVAGSNGHVHARCTTPGCANWME